MATLTEDRINLLYEAASKGRIVTLTSVKPSNIAVLLQSGHLQPDGNADRLYVLTERGQDALRGIQIRAIQVDFPGQPPLILRDEAEFVSDAAAGMIQDTFDCWLDQRLGADDGDPLFSVSVKVISLYDLATLPEWEPV